MQKLPAWGADVATARRCGQIYIPFRIFRGRAQAYWQKVTQCDVYFDDEDPNADEVGVMIETNENNTGSRKIVTEAHGISIMIKPIYRYLTWPRQASNYKVPVTVEENILRFSLKKNLHQGN